MQTRMNVTANCLDCSRLFISQTETLLGAWGIQGLPSGGLAPCPATTELKKEGRGESGTRCDVELEVRALPPLQLSTKRHTPALVSCSGPGVRIAFPLLLQGQGPLLTPDNRQTPTSGGGIDLLTHSQEKNNRSREARRRDGLVWDGEYFWGHNRNVWFFLKGRNLQESGQSILHMWV